MNENDVPAHVTQFVFEHIDSVELLEVLILMRNLPEKAWSSEQLSNELRSTQKSVSSRLTTLRDKGFIVESPENKGTYFYKPEIAEQIPTIDALAEIYKIKRHKIYELIFSPVKKIRFFADAFMLGKQNDKKEGGSDG